MEKKQEVVSRLGSLLKNIPYEHGKEYDKVFNLAHNTFFQKMIPLKIVECGFDIETERYFGLMIFLDYFTNVLLGEDRVLNNLRSIYKNMKEKDEKFSVSSNLVVLESALTAKEFVMENKSKIGKNYFRECTAEIRKRFNQQNHVLDFSSGSMRKTDPYYNAVGLMIYDLFSDESKEELLHVSGKQGLKALLFTDYASKYLKDKNLRDGIKESIRKHDYFTASVMTIDELQREATTSLDEFKQNSDG